MPYGESIKVSLSEYVMPTGIKRLFQKYPKGPIGPKFKYPSNEPECKRLAIGAITKEQNSKHNAYAGNKRRARLFNQSWNDKLEALLYSNNPDKQKNPPTASVPKLIEVFQKIGTATSGFPRKIGNEWE
jgi:hypothetical protein